MRAAGIILIPLVAAGSYALVQTLRGKPIIPKWVSKAIEGSGDPAQTTKTQYTINDMQAGTGKSGQTDKPAGSDPVSAAISNLVSGAAALGKDIGSALSSQVAIPLEAAVGSAGATIAIQRYLAGLKGVPAVQNDLVTTGGGLVKTADQVAADVTAPFKVTATGGQGAVKAQLVSDVPKAPSAIDTTPALNDAAAVVSDSAKAGVDAAKVAGLVGRVVSKLNPILLPIGVGMTAYDLAQQVQQKGAENVTVGNVVGDITGLSGFGLSKYVPPQLDPLVNTSVLGGAQQVNTALLNGLQQASAGLAGAGQSIVGAFSSLGQVLQAESKLAGGS